MRRARRLRRTIDFLRDLRHLFPRRAARSRPAYPRHFAQALHFARSPGRGLLAQCLILRSLEFGGGIGASNVRHSLRIPLGRRRRRVAAGSGRARTGPSAPSGQIILRCPGPSTTARSAAAQSSVVSTPPGDEICLALTGLVLPLSRFRLRHRFAGIGPDSSPRSLRSSELSGRLWKCGATLSERTISATNDRRVRRRVKQPWAGTLPRLCRSAVH
jgi:hypothetical protein